MDRETEEKIIELNKKLGLRTEFIEDKEVLGYSLGRTIYINIGIEQDYEKTNKHEILHFYEETEEFKKIKEQVLEENKENLEEIRKEYEMRYYGLYSEEEIKAGVLENEIVIDMLIENSVIEYKEGLEVGEKFLGEIKEELEFKRYLNMSLKSNIQNMKLSKWEKIFVQNYYDGKERKLPAKEGREESVKKEIEDRLQELYEMREEDFEIDSNSPEIIREYESEIKALKHRGEDTSGLESDRDRALKSLAERFSKQLWEEYKHIVDFIKEEEYEPAFKYLMLKETLTKTYKREKSNGRNEEIRGETKSGEREELLERKTEEQEEIKAEEQRKTIVKKRDLRKSIAGHMVLNKTTLDIMYEYAESSDSFANIYFGALEVFNETIAEKNEITIEGIETFDKGKWLKFEGKTSNEEEYLKNAEKLAALVKDTPWCTKTLASSQLAEGDFYVFVDDEGNPHIAVKTTGQEIDEVRGIKNGFAQELEEEYREVAISFLEKNKEIKNGKEWLEKEEWNKRLIEYSKKIDEGSFKKEDVESLIQDLFYFKDYKNHGGYENSNKTKLKRKLESIKGLLAEHYNVKKSEIHCGDIEFSRRFKKCKYKVILGDASFAMSNEMNLDNLECIEGSANFRNSQITSLGNLRSIGDAVNFRNSQITSLGNLQSIGGTVTFSNSQITDLGNLISVGGADFRESQVTSLGSLQEILGNADFRESQVTSLGNLQEILGNADFRESQITSLGNLQNIDGNVTFRNSNVTDLGNLRRIGGNADFIGSKITDLKNLESIESNVFFKGTLIVNLGKLKRIGKDTLFVGSKVKDLGDLQEIGGDADFSGSHITSLNKLQKIGGNANFESSYIEDLGDLQEIGGDADFRDSNIESLGDLERVGGEINLEDSKIIDLGKLKKNEEEIKWGNEARKEWNKRLVEYNKKIDEGTFSKDDVEDLIFDLFIRNHGNYENRNRLILQKKLNNIKGIIAEHYGIDESEICCEDVNFGREGLTECPYRMILGCAIFDYSEITDLGKLQLIGEEAFFRDSRVTNLGNLKIIGSHADFANSRITSLQNLQSIGGDAYFKRTRITDLGNLQRIGGNVSFDGTRISSLKNLVSIGGKADFYGSRITDLGNLLNVGGGIEWSYRDDLREQYEKRTEVRKEMEEMSKIAQGQKADEFLEFVSEITEMIQENNKEIK